MCEIGNRLRLERERLQLNQTEFSTIAGVSKNSQSNYEKGLRAPDTVYLGSIAKAGVDVLYVVTGQRTGDPVPLSRDEVALLDNYRHSPDEGKKAIQTTSFAFAQHKKTGDADKIA